MLNLLTPEKPTAEQWTKIARHFGTFQDFSKLHAKNFYQREAVIGGDEKHTFTTYSEIMPYHTSVVFAQQLVKEYKALCPDPQDNRPFFYNEVGPGNGTMALHTLKVLSFLAEQDETAKRLKANIRYGLHDISPALQKKQREALGELAHTYRAEQIAFYLFPDRAPESDIATFFEVFDDVHHEHLTVTATGAVFISCPIHIVALKKGATKAIQQHSVRNQSILTEAGYALSGLKPDQYILTSEQVFAIIESIKATDTLTVEVPLEIGNPLLYADPTTKKRIAYVVAQLNKDFQPKQAEIDGEESDVRPAAVIPAVVFPKSIVMTAGIESYAALLEPFKNSSTVLIADYMADPAAAFQRVAQGTKPFRRFFTYNDQNPERPCDDPYVVLEAGNLTFDVNSAELAAALEQHGWNVHEANAFLNHVKLGLIYDLFHKTSVEDKKLKLLKEALHFADIAQKRTQPSVGAMVHREGLTFIVARKTTAPLPKMCTIPKPSDEQVIIRRHTIWNVLIAEFLAYFLPMEKIDFGEYAAGKGAQGVLEKLLATLPEVKTNLTMRLHRDSADNILTWIFAKLFREQLEQENLQTATVWLVGNIIPLMEALIKTMLNYPKLADAYLQERSSKLGNQLKDFIARIVCKHWRTRYKEKLPKWVPGLLTALTKILIMRLPKTFVLAMIAAAMRINDAQMLRALLNRLDRAELINQPLPEDPAQNTALHSAAQEKNLPFFLLLLEYGADPTVLNNKNETAFDVHQAWLTTELRSLLRKEYPNATDEAHCLRLAGSKDQLLWVKIVLFLNRSIPDFINIKGPQSGKTVLDQTPAGKCYNYLRQQGAKTSAELTAFLSAVAEQVVSVVSPPNP